MTDYTAMTAAVAAERNAPIVTARRVGGFNLVETGYPVEVGPKNIVLRYHHKHGRADVRCRRDSLSPADEAAIAAWKARQ